MTIFTTVPDEVHAPPSGIYMNLLSINVLCTIASIHKLVRCLTVMMCNKSIVQFAAKSIASLAKIDVFSCVCVHIIIIELAGFSYSQYVYAKCRES